MRKKKCKTFFAVVTATCGMFVTLAAMAAEGVTLAQWEFRRPGEAWRTVRVPHDWAIAGPFDREIDKQVVAIVQNGEKVATEKTGRTGSLPWIGTGEYRTRIAIPEGTGFASLVFDGVMSEPEVFFDGRKVGEWKYGYNAFEVELPAEPGEHEVRVTVRNLPESSRWYPGAGIIRPVRLVLGNATGVRTWGQAIACPDLRTVKVTTDCRGKPGRIAYRVLDGEKVVATSETGVLTADFTPWSPENPRLYTLETTVTGEDGKVADRVTTRFGVRTLEYGDGAFRLNGQARKFKGVCLHHDLGPLGAAFDRDAFVRQVTLLKEMGCDSIRTSHNMPADEQLAVCDELGMMVMAESFDSWKEVKVENGYNRFFDDWWRRDLTNLVLKCRNHPSVVMWSIGNEISEQVRPDAGVRLAQEMQALCHALDPDPGRKVTQGLSTMPGAIESGVNGVMEIPGVTYRLPFYEAMYRATKTGIVLGAETASTISSRGEYFFPVKPTPTEHHHPNLQCSGYDVEWCPWSNLPDDDWAKQDDLPWTIGEFVWTGFDYLGEPTPYDGAWPSRSSYFGILDLAGLPKDRYWLYRSRWQAKDHTLHLVPHWTFPGREGEVTPVYCYTDFDEAELFVNGKSQGRIRKNPQSRLDRYRLRWNDVVYQPGELKVVAYGKDGRAAMTETVRTAGAPVRAELRKRRFGRLLFVTATLVDAAGTPVPNADRTLSFTCGEGLRFRAICNGDATSLESFVRPRMKTFHGQLVAIFEGAGDEVVCMDGLAACPPPMHQEKEREELSLAGEWAFALDPENVGLEQNWTTNAFTDTIRLPGTTDLAKKGDGKVGGNVTERIHPQLVGADMAKRLTMHLTRRFPFVGTAWYRREVVFPSAWANRRVTLSFERTKILTLFVDGEKIGTRHSLVAAQTFELPEKFATGRHVLTLAVDNRIDQLPVSGHQVSDDTQTNWNGVIGELKAIATDKVAIDRVRVTPLVADRTADVEVTLVNRLENAADGEVTVTGGLEPVTAKFVAARSGASVRLCVPFAKDAAPWDEFNPALHKLRVTLKAGDRSDATEVRFGFCEFRTKGTQFTVNGKPVFLRGRHDACVWPKTGCPPMDKPAWLGYFRTLKAWGLNHVRCHSWVLPRAAFEAADETGFYLQPEFGRFGGDFTSDEWQRLYALAEAQRTSDAYGNSPSFVMWSYSNEPLCHSGALAELVAKIRAYDPRRLYAQASNGDYNAPHPNPGDDFWSTFRSCPGAEGNVRASYANCDLPLGRVQTGPADTLGDFSPAVPHAKVPLIGHEVGQYESYPDLNEIAKYDGVLRAISFEIFSNRLEKAGLLDQANDFFRASAALQAINYREDVEEALRTPGFGGFQLLDLQDFPGQGTALVGLLNAFMEPKGVVTADEWRQWCAPTVLLARFASYVHHAGDVFRAKVECAHYGREDEIGTPVVWRIAGSGGRVLGSGELPLRAVRGQVAAAAKEIAFALPETSRAEKLTLNLALKGRVEHTSYPLWTYPKAAAVAAPSVEVVRDLATGEKLMKEGKKVLCILDRTAFPTNSVEGRFASDFWCYPMFRHVCEFLKMKPAPGTLGLLVQKDHPALAGFPTDFHSDYQWFDLVQNSVSVILDDQPRGYRPIVQTIDNSARNHRLGLVYERTEGKGRLVVCGADLVALKGHPAADQLHRSLIGYMTKEEK